MQTDAARVDRAEHAIVPALRAVCSAVLETVPGGSALVFDEELRVRLAEGDGFARAGLQPAELCGRLLPEVVAPRAWTQLSGPYEAALAGTAASLTFAARGTVFSIRVSPLTLPDEKAAALVVTNELTDQRRLESVILEQKSDARDAEELSESAFDRAPIGMTVSTPDGTWLRVNQAYCRMLGYNRHELVGMSHRDVTHPDDVAQDIAFTAAAIAGEAESLEREKRYVCRDGSIVWAHVRVEVIRDAAGDPRYYLSHVQDISGRRAAEGSRRDSERTLRSVIDNTPALLYVKDRDHRYELVNREFEDVYGVRSDWIVGRGDEEILDASALAEVRAKDQLVLDSGQSSLLEETVLRDGRERVFLTMRFPLLDDEGETNAVCVISTDVTERRREERDHRERLQCLAGINSALAQNRFVLHGQPIVNLATMQAEQAELLIRMIKVRGSDELAAPGEFLPLAERFDLISVIDEWVVGQAVEMAASGHRVEVNLSAKTISDPAQVAQIARTVIESGAPPQNVIFEITETAVADNIDAARDFAVRLRELGCAFALDDFGVGHGAFTYLKHLPVDYLKIDIQFVRDLLTDEADRQVVHAIVGVARDFEIKTIAEGVEDESTLLELRRIGVDYAQGYWIGRPGPLGEMWKTQDRGDAHASRV